MVLAFANFKGGVGKTTLAVNLAFALAERGLVIGLMDLDPAFHLSVWLGSGGSNSAVRVLPASRELHQSILRGDTKIRSLERELGCDMLILDTAPGFTKLTQIALSAANAVVVPVTLDFLAIAGFRQVWREIRGRKPLLGVVPCGVERRSRLGQEVLAWLEVHAAPLLPPIPRSARLRECPLAGSSIFQFASGDRTALSFRVLAEEVVRRVEQGVYVRPRI